MKNPTGFPRRGYGLAKFQVRVSREFSDSSRDRLPALRKTHKPRRPYVGVA